MLASQPACRQARTNKGRSKIWENQQRQKSLEPGYYGQAPAGSPSFRDGYVKEYGHNAWDERVKVLEGSIVKTEVYLMRLRKDLSSQ